MLHEVNAKQFYRTVVNTLRTAGQVWLQDCMLVCISASPPLELAQEYSLQGSPVARQLAPI